MLAIASHGIQLRFVVASDMLFDSKGQASRSSYPTKTAEIEGLRVVVMETDFGATLHVNGLW